MNNKDLKDIVAFLRSGMHFNFANEYADSLESGEWKDEMKALTFAKKSYQKDE